LTPDFPDRHQWQLIQYTMGIHKFDDIHVLATEVFKFYFVNFYIAETRLYILLKLTQFTLNKQ